MLISSCSALSRIWLLAYFLASSQKHYGRLELSTIPLLQSITPSLLTATAHRKIDALSGESRIYSPRLVPPCIP